VETLLKQHFAKEMGYEGRMFDERELQYIRERAKLGAPPHPLLPPPPPPPPRHLCAVH
jgi:hypothetical protein